MMKKNSPEKADKILVIKLCCIGDLVELTPAMRALKTSGAKVHHLCLPGMKAVSGMIPFVSRTIEFEHGFGGLCRTLNRIRAEKYALIINFHRDIKSHVFCALAGGWTAGFSWGAGKMLLRRVFPFRPELHETERYLEITRGLGFSDAGNYTEISVPAAQKTIIRIKEGRKAGLFPGGGKNAGTIMMTKRWPKESFIKTGKLLMKRGYDIYVFGGEMDRENVEAVCGGIGKASAVITGLEDFVYYVSKMDLFIGPDTGPLHLASAAGTKTIGLFGPTSPVNFGARGKHAVNLWKPAECAPCYEPGTVHKREFLNCRDNTCMEQILPEDVIKAVETLEKAGSAEKNG
ncbi:MAG TPA: glycosyltransferase family 9 protein [bacterium]|nr:glycosyltransferase family 9 protein [bacterium]